MKEEGFSLVEVTVCGFVILTVCAVSLAPLQSSLRSYRLSAAASSVSDVLFKARKEAVTLNTNRDVIFAPAAGQFGIDANADGVLDAAEAVTLPANARLQLPPGTAATVRFNSRGEMPLSAPATVIPGVPVIRVQSDGLTQQVSVTLRGNVSVANPY
jgi:Tfp pilus assembly protein FimT